MTADRMNTRIAVPGIGHARAASHARETRHA